MNSLPEIDPTEREVSWRDNYRVIHERGHRVPPLAGGTLFKSEEKALFGSGGAVAQLNGWVKSKGSIKAAQEFGSPMAVLVRLRAGAVCVTVDGFAPIDDWRRAAQTKRLDELPAFGDVRPFPLKGSEGKSKYLAIVSASYAASLGTVSKSVEDLKESIRDVAFLGFGEFGQVRLGLNSLADCDAVWDFVNSSDRLAVRVSESQDLEAALQWASEVRAGDGGERYEFVIVMHDARDVPAPAYVHLRSAADLGIR